MEFKCFNVVTVYTPTAKQLGQKDTSSEKRSGILGLQVDCQVKR